MNNCGLDCRKRLTSTLKMEAAIKIYLATTENQKGMLCYLFCAESAGLVSSKLTIMFLGKRMQYHLLYASYCD